MAPVYYHLHRFPPTDLNLASMVGVIGRANAAIARYDGMVAAIPNSNVLLSPLFVQEAVLSSRIEGTQVTIGEVLEIEAEADSSKFDIERKHDAEEVRNYRNALLSASLELGQRGITQHLLRQSHALLMDGVRGAEKSPGHFREEQNWIGAAGAEIDEASFIPIPQEHLHAGLETWERSVSDPDPEDPLVQLAIIHLEFEALHPFKDGNGRLGRMIIPLYLAQQRVISGPHFYMSGYLDTNREEYVARMRDVSDKGEWEEWVRFFLLGIEEQANLNREKASGILTLYTQMLHEVAELTHSQYAAKTVDYIFTRPVFSSSVYVEDCGIPRPTALRILGVLRDAALLVTVRPSSGRRAAIYAFAPLLNIAEGREVL